MFAKSFFFSGSLSGEQNLFLLKVQLLDVSSKACTLHQTLASCGEAAPALTIVYDIQFASSCVSIPKQMRNMQTNKPPTPFPLTRSFNSVHVTAFHQCSPSAVSDCAISVKRDSQTFNGLLRVLLADSERVLFPGSHF